MLQRFDLQVHAAVKFVSPFFAALALLAAGVSLAQAPSNPPARSVIPVLDSAAIKKRCDARAPPERAAVQACAGAAAA